MNVQLFKNNGQYVDHSKLYINPFNPRKIVQGMSQKHHLLLLGTSKKAQTNLAVFSFKKRKNRFF